MASPQTESRLIVLTELQNRIEDAHDNMNKWVTVIDEEGNAEIFMKYQGTTIFSILEKETAPESLCRTLLTMVRYTGTLTVNFLDLPYQDLFNEKYFPKGVMEKAWINDKKNIEKLRQNFLTEFPEELRPSKDFKICFLFRKPNVPEELYEKTHVVEVCPPKEIGQRLAEREEKALAAKKIEEEKKVEETKTDAAKPKTGTTPAKTGAKTTTGTTGAKTTTTAKTGASPVKAGTTTGTKTTPTKAAAPVKTVASKASPSTTKTTGSGTKPKCEVELSV